MQEKIRNEKKLQEKSSKRRQGKTKEYKRIHKNTRGKQEYTRKNVLMRF